MKNTLYICKGKNMKGLRQSKKSRTNVQRDSETSSE